MMYLWLNTYWLPAMAILGGLIVTLWFLNKAVGLIERFGARVVRSWHSAVSEHSSNSN